jgi:uridine kinase
MIIIGVAGASGSGKSLLSKTIVDELGSSQVAVISEDHYYKDRSDIPMEEREKINYDHPEAFDHELFCYQIQQLLNGYSVDVPVYDYNYHARSNEVLHVGYDKSIIVLEGILIFHDPELRELMDIKIYMDTPSDIALIRRIQRDIHERNRTLDSVITQYQETVRPMFLQFVEPTKKYADIIVPQGGKNKIAIDVIRAKLKELLDINTDSNNK